MLLDAITSSSTLQLLITFVCVGLVYLYYRNSPSPPPIAREDNGVEEDIHQTIARIERQERDMIRQEQDEAYKISLEADKQKERKRLEEAERKQAEEKERLQKEQEEENLRNSLLELKRSIHSKLPNEPLAATQDDKTLRLVIKLPNGTRISRRFSKDEPVKHLYWFVFGHETAPLRFQITTNFPRREIPGRPPVPNDFFRDAQGSLSSNDKTETKVTRQSEPASKNADNETKLNAIDYSNPEPNCEVSLKEAGLTQSEMLFVYDLEA